MKIVVYALLVVLMLAHQDYWLWRSHQPLVFGFMPAGLAWHTGISLSAGLLWAMAVRFCWPTDLEADEDAFAAAEKSA